MLHFVKSLPSRERGLKFRPHWIVDISVQSLPSRERGLKYRPSDLQLLPSFVAPFAGAWIEISDMLEVELEQIVAPFAGAWIEIE